MNKYKVRIAQHHTFIIEADTGKEAIDNANQALLSNTDNRVMGHRIVTTKSPRVEIMGDKDVIVIDYLKKKE